MRASAGPPGRPNLDVLQKLAPDAECDRVRPADADAALPGGTGLEGCDAGFLTGSPLHLYQDTPETRREVAFGPCSARNTGRSGSCAGLQVATVATGCALRRNANRCEAAFARRIAPTRTDPSATIAWT